MMKLSEAIRLGAMSTEQCFGTKVWKFDDGSYATCAIGAALFSIGKLSSLLMIEWPWVASVYPACPACPACSQPKPGFGSGLNKIIAHLNDYHKWSREHIADWVATIEPGLVGQGGKAEIFCEAEALLV